MPEVPPTGECISGRNAVLREKKGQRKAFAVGNLLQGKTGSEGASQRGGISKLVEFTKHSDEAWGAGLESRIVGLDGLEIHHYCLSRWRLDTTGSKSRNWKEK